MKPGRDGAAARVERARGVRRELAGRAERGDAAVADRRARRGGAARAGAVDEDSVRDDQIEARHGMRLLRAHSTPRVDTTRTAFRRTDASMPTPPDAPRELTLRALLLGSVLGICFAASSVYLGLKVGLTVSASIPIAVLSITLFRALGRSSILENNIVQTTGSAGESIAAGVAFTLPSLLLMGFELDLLRDDADRAARRRARRADDDPAAARADRARARSAAVPGRHGLRGGAARRRARRRLGAHRLRAGSARAASSRCSAGSAASGATSRAGRSVARCPAAASRSRRNPALLGVGYVIGTRIALVMLAGGVLSYLVLIPAIHIFGPELTLAADRRGRDAGARDDARPGAQRVPALRRRRRRRDRRPRHAGARAADDLARVPRGPRERRRVGRGARAHRSRPADVARARRLARARRSRSRWRRRSASTRRPPRWSCSSASSS